MIGYRFQQFGFAVSVISLAFAWYGLLSGNDKMVIDSIIVSISGLVSHLIGHFINQ